jgi:undecaprenyl-diphosphatase
LSPVATAVAAGTIAGGAVLFAATAGQARRREVSASEQQVFQTLNALPDGLRHPTWAVMQAGSLGAVPVVAGLAVGAGRHRTAVGLAVAGTVAWGLPKLVKRGIKRGRPGAHLDDVTVRGQAQRGLGFPSGHAAVSTSIAVVAGPVLPLPARLAAGAVAAETAAARMYVGAHLPLDIAGGVGLGLVIGGLTDLVLGSRRHERRH